MPEMRIWYDDEETGRYPVVRTIERSARAPLDRLNRPGRVTAEWQRAQAGHPSTYGLLGACFVPDPSGFLQIVVEIGNRVEPETDPGIGLLGVFQKYPGINSGSYAAGKFAAVMVPEDMDALGSGVLKFDRALEEIPATSPMMYG